MMHHRLNALGRSPWGAGLRKGVNLYATIYRKNKCIYQCKNSHLAR